MRHYYTGLISPHSRSVLVLSTRSTSNLTLQRADNMPCGCTGVCNVLQRSEEGLAGHSATPASPCPPATTLSLPPPTQNLFAAARVHMALRTRQRDPENDTMRKGGAPATANSSRKRCCLVIQEPPAPEVGATDVASSASNNPKASCGSYRPTHSTKLYN